MTSVALSDGSRLVLRWHCSNCLLDHPEAFCSVCGASLPLTNEPGSSSSETTAERSSSAQENQA